MTNITWGAESDWNAADKTNVAVDGNSFQLASVTPDSVVSREQDTGTFDTSSATGLVINPNSSFGKIAARISSQTVNVTRARIYDFSQGSYVNSVDISGLSAGDVFTFDYDFVADTDYALDLDANGSTYGQGFYATDTYNYPYTSTDIDIVSRSDGSGSTTTSKNPICLNDIGNPDNVLV